MEKHLQTLKGSRFLSDYLRSKTAYTQHNNSLSSQKWSEDEDKYYQQIASDYIGHIRENHQNSVTSSHHIFNKHTCTKRAAMYRTMLKVLTNSISKESIIDEEIIGNQDGTDKKASSSWVVIEPDKEHQILDIVLKNIDAKLTTPETNKICRIPNHAIARMFQRLKTTDFNLISDNIAAAIEGAFAATKHLTTETPYDEYYVSTPSGVAILALNTTRNTLIVKTFLSDNELKPHQKEVLIQARENNQAIMKKKDNHFIIINDNICFESFINKTKQSLRKISETPQIKQKLKLH